MPEISIIVPVYKVEAYLDRCVNSILNQTFKDFELILVDDGSPDRCPQMCDEWAEKDDRIKVIHKENGGLSSARNVGLKIASGNYIGFVDSDDWIVLDMYEILYSLIIKYDADISCGQLKIVNDFIPYIKEKNIIKVNSQNEYAEKYFKIKSNDTVHYVVNKLYKSYVAKSMIFPEGLINEDVEGFFRALIAAKKVVSTSKVVYFYYKNTDSISFKWFSHKQMDLLTVWKHVCELCETEKKEWLNDAKINYYRAHFGLLLRLALNDEKEDDVYIEERKYLIKKLLNYRRVLIESYLPLNRKIILLCMCINYDLTKKLIRFFYRKINKEVYN